MEEDKWQKLIIIKTNSVFPRTILTLNNHIKIPLSDRFPEKVSSPPAQVTALPLKLAGYFQCPYSSSVVSLPVHVCLEFTVQYGY